MLERAQHFEIFSRRDGRWTLEATRVRLDESVALATELLARGPYEAVRIVRARSVEGRTLVETVVYQAERTDEREPPIRLAAADDRDCVCETFEDFLGPRSRRAIGAMLRDFLDRAGITPSELLHLARHARRLEDTGTLLSAAVQRAARVAALAGGRPAAQGRSFIEGAIEEALRRAVTAQADRRHPVPEPGELDAFLARIDARGGEILDRRLAVFHGIARSLEGERSILARLTRVLEWGARARESASLQVVDSLLADCLGSGKVVSELLGQRPNLAAALGTILAIARGRAFTMPGQAADWQAGFATFVAAHAVPETRAILLGRVQRALAGDRRLTHGDADAEASALADLAESLSDESCGGFVGGEAMVDALRRRWRRLDKPGGFPDLADPRGTPAERFRRLLEAEGRVFGEMRKRAVATVLIDILRDIPIDSRAEVADLRPAIERAGLLEPATRILLRESAAER